MADGVYGTVIDTETLKGMPEYRGKTIRRADMAKVARDLMNAGGKDTNCLKYVENLRDEYGNRVKVYTEIREGGHYKDTLGDIQDKVENGNDTSNDEWTGCTSTTTIATGTTTSFVGIMSLTPPVS
ncbi:hypothetical protein LguiA_002145 [Lonicera macranthoides]